MAQRFGERDPIVRPPGGPGKAGARGRECLETELLEENRAAAIPGIRDDEAAPLVQFVKAADLTVHEIRVSIAYAPFRLQSRRT